MKILGIDIGFGDVKITYGTSNGNILQQFKFPSVLGITEKNQYVQDPRILEYKGYCYIIGEDSLKLPTENLIDITEYKNLEYYAPLFLYYAIKKLGELPDVIVSGLSKAQIEQSGHFKNSIKNFKVNQTQYNFDAVYILPQGAGSKLTIDKYGNNFPEAQKSFTGNTTYVGCDIGFNTLDMFYVTNGKTSTNLFEGIEKQGIMKIAVKLAEKVKEKFGKTINLHEAKEILDTNAYKLRGKETDFTDINAELKKQYLADLLELVESRYGNILDKCDFINLNGGGSTLFKNTEDQFFKVPLKKNEYYNSIGQYLFGINQV